MIKLTREVENTDKVLLEAQHHYITYNVNMRPGMLQSQTPCRESQRVMLVVDTEKYVEMNKFKNVNRSLSPKCVT